MTLPAPSVGREKDPDDERWNARRKPWCGEQVAQKDEEG